MISFFFTNINNFSEGISRLIQWFASDSSFSFATWKIVYRIVINLLLFFDVIIFAIAYLIESEYLSNKIKSVDSTLSGWISALVCYPPFNFFISNFLLTNGLVVTSRSVPLLDLPFVIFIQTFGVVFLIIYVWATIALGFRAGNLVNRGIVARGPYRYVRHPAYLGKNLFFLFEILPFIYSPIQLIHWFFWVLVYVARAITEEAHLMADSSYQEYAQKVRYRFIPYLI